MKFKHEIGLFLKPIKRDDFVSFFAAELESGAASRPGGLSYRTCRFIH